MRQGGGLSLRETPVRRFYVKLKSLLGGRSQSDEAAILVSLVSKLNIPNTFVEFGFHPNEFNCIGLRHRFAGLLIDGDESTVSLARSVLPRTIDVEARFLTLANLDLVERRYHPGQLGILSIDVDGNDFWFLKRLIRLKPSVIAVEYNASLLLHPVTVAYDPHFDRHNKHPSGWYHGASIVALHRLCEAHGYHLVSVAAGGGNAFFVRSDSMASDLPQLKPQDAYRECLLRNKWSSTNAHQQWNAIRTLPFVEIEETFDFDRD
jgi:hypothetical protein